MWRPPRGAGCSGWGLCPPGMLCRSEDLVMLHHACSVGFVPASSRDFPCPKRCCPGHLLSPLSPCPAGGAGPGSTHGAPRGPRLTKPPLSLPRQLFCDFGERFVVVDPAEGDPLYATVQHISQVGGSVPPPAPQHGAPAASQLSLGHFSGLVLPQSDSPCSPLPLLRATRGS